MPTDVQKITNARKEQRDSTQMEHRAALALEQIADTLEAIRADNVGFYGSLIRVLEALPRNLPSR